MGTNYYCKYKKQELHIGKSSCGWHFSLCIYPELGISSLADWKEVWSKPRIKIKDEYNTVIPVQEMIDRITNRTVLDPGEDVKDFEARVLKVENEMQEKYFDCRHHFDSYDDYLAFNHAARGLNGLLAHNDCYHYRTDGTYDLTLETDFS